MKKILFFSQSTLCTKSPFWPASEQSLKELGKPNLTFLAISGKNILSPVISRRHLMGNTKALSEEKLQEIIRRVVQVTQPERIILFGSAVRGEMGPNSDVDLLVVKAGEFDQGRLTGEVYMHLHGVGEAVDVILVTPEQVERYRNTHYLVIAPALREGKEVYHA
jgi:uncharacterized protein